MEDLKRQSLEKQSQEKLAKARELLTEAAQLAEQGGFVIYFNAGGAYVPKAAFDKTKVREEAIQELKEQDPEFVTLSPEAQEEHIDDWCNDILSDMRPYGADEPGWWRPSRTC